MEKKNKYIFNRKKSYPRLSFKIRTSLSIALFPETESCMAHRGVTKIVEVGRVTSIKFSKGMINVTIQVASSSIPTLMFQIDRWNFAYSSKNRGEAFKELSLRLKEGMLVAIQGERRTVLRPQRLTNGLNGEEFIQVNRAEKITILDYRGGVSEKYKREFEIYDKIARNYEFE